MRNAGRLASRLVAAVVPAFYGRALGRYFTSEDQGSESTVVALAGEAKEGEVV